MSENNAKVITASELRTYLYSLEREKKRKIAEEVQSYRMECNISNTRPKKREVARIEKYIEKEYSKLLEIKDGLIRLINEAEEIPQNIEELEIVEYMLYRVDLKKAEKVVNKAQKRLWKRCQDIQQKIVTNVEGFSKFERVESIDYSEYDTDGTKIAKSKEQYKLELTEEERNKLIEKDLDMVDKAIQFNTIPIPHEILKNSDRDIQSKMQRFNSIRQKRIRILESMKEDYKKLIEPREILATIDEAFNCLNTVKDILTGAEYRAVKNTLIRRRKRIFRSTNDVRALIEAKEKKTGIANFNIQQARYLRMENLRKIVVDGSRIIRENPLDELEEQLEKLKIAYAKEKQYASVIERLEAGRGRKTN